MSSKEFENNKPSDRISDRNFIRTAINEYALGNISFDEFDKVFSEVYSQNANVSRSAAHREVIECLAQLNLDGRVSPSDASERIEPLNAFPSLNKEGDN